jgi:hypothetical protein
MLLFGRHRTGANSVRHIPSTTRTTVQASHGDAEAAVGQNALMRGLVHGIILSMIVWLTAGYLTLALR